MKFEDLGIAPEMLRAINEKNFSEPTTIQEKSIPLILQGKDIVAGSATGSGKTLAFGAGIIKACAPGAGIQSLILTPTRELAEQVMKSLAEFSRYKNLKVAAVYGGVSLGPQVDALKKVDIVVGTPGRILDHIERNSINLSNVRVLVLDEADRMLDMGFLEDVERIIRSCPRDRQTMLFSATIPPEISHLSQKFMRNPLKVRAEESVDPTKLKQIYYDVSPGMKLSLLVHLLQQEHSGLVMVFCNSRRYVDVVAKTLHKNGVDAEGIHGGLSQHRRTEIMSKFNSNKAFALVCTDVAARGLDIPGVSHVYNFDIPNDPKQYVHRIGRTARAGKSGLAVNLISPRDHENFGRVQRDFTVDVEKVERPQIKMISAPPKKHIQRKKSFSNRRRNY